MDCVTPSHPEKIPHGESLDIMQLLEKGEDAFLDPNIVPTDGAIKLDKYTYTPRKSVMAELDGGSNPEVDVAYIKAQITSDDKELKSIVKEAEASSSASTGDKSSGSPNRGSSSSSGSGSGSGSTSRSPRGRRPKPKVPIPPHAQPQQAILMEVEDRWEMGFKKALGAGDGGGKPWLTERAEKVGWARRWANDGWEV
jgi:DNA polymerase gamma 1